MSPTRTEDLSEEIKKNTLLIKSKKSKYGLESTVIKVEKNKIYILRMGSITVEELKKDFPKYNIISNSLENNLSPGNQKRHYSPNLPIRINIKSVKKEEGLLNFGKNKLKSSICEFNLSIKSDLNEAANNFYHFLNLLDKSNCKKIAVAPIPNNGIGKTINDRLKRAIADD